MGILNEKIKSKQISHRLKFILNFTTEDKVELIKNLSDDFLIDKSAFVSFFQSDESAFEYLDNNQIGLVSSWDLLLIIKLLKNENKKNKINGILSIFCVLDSNVYFF